MAASVRYCIKNNVVVNIIYADDDHVNLLDQARIYNSIVKKSDYPNAFVNPGYTFDGYVFMPPADTTDINTQIQIKIQKAIIGFNELAVGYAAANVLQGITQMGKTKLIADTLADVMRYGQSGSLYQVISALQAIVITPEMSPFITSAKITSMIADISNLLATL